MGPPLGQDNRVKLEKLPGLGYPRQVLQLSDILTKDRVTVDFSAREKPAALLELAGLFDSLDSDRVFEIFTERESLASTGVGSGVAIPHGKYRELPSMQAALAISERGVSFDSVDGEPVCILVGLLAPSGPGGAHLKALARISKVLRRASVRKSLLEATSADEAFSLLIAADE